MHSRTRLGSVLDRLLARLGDQAVEFVDRHTLEHTEVAARQRGVFEVVQQHAAVVALLGQQLGLGMAQAGDLVLLGRAGRVQLTPTRQFGDGRSTMLVEQFSRLGPEQVIAMAGLAERNQVTVATSEATQKGRQALAREHTRRGSLDVGLDTQLERFDLAPEQRRETFAQFCGHVDVRRAGVLGWRRAGPTLGAFIGAIVDIRLAIRLGATGFDPVGARRSRRVGRACCGGRCAILTRRDIHRRGFSHGVRRRHRINAGRRICNSWLVGVRLGRLSRKSGSSGNVGLACRPRVIGRCGSRGCRQLGLGNKWGHRCHVADAVGREGCIVPIAEAVRRRPPQGCAEQACRDTLPAPCIRPVSARPPRRGAPSARAP